MGHRCENRPTLWPTTAFDLLFSNESDVLAISNMHWYATKNCPWLHSRRQGCSFFFVDAVQIARDLFRVDRDPIHGHPDSSTVLVINVRGFDVNGPTIPRQPGGSITRPPSGGLGCPACADNVNMRSPSHDRNPKHCRWYDKEDYHWE
eukprot:2490909-Pyramimonas_sp.AAC.1